MIRHISTLRKQEMQLRLIFYLLVLLIIYLGSVQLEGRGVPPLIYIYIWITETILFHCLYVNFSNFYAEPPTTHSPSPLKQGAFQCVFVTESWNSLKSDPTLFIFSTPWFSYNPNGAVVWIREKILLHTFMGAEESGHAWLGEGKLKKKRQMCIFG